MGPEPDVTDDDEYSEYEETQAQEVEECEGVEKNEEDDRVEGDQIGGEGDAVHKENKDVSNEPSLAPFLSRKWFWDAGNAILKILGMGPR